MTTLIGETIGRYIGDLSVERIRPGQYKVTGPRGSVTLTKSRERVFVRNWARSRTVTMTVWNPSDCTAELNMWHKVRSGSTRCARLSELDTCL